MRSGVVFFFGLFSSVAFAQLDSNSVTVTVSQTASVQADQAVFSVSVSSGVNKSLADIVSALQSVGITMSNFTGLNSYGTIVSGNQVNFPTLIWAFTLAVPIAKVSDTANALEALENSIGQNKSGLSLSFGVTGTQISQDALQTQPCSLTDLLSNARTKAQNLATAAGLKVGSILAMSTSTASGAASVALISDYLTTAAVPNCTVTVKFALANQ